MTESKGCGNIACVGANNIWENRVMNIYEKMKLIIDKSGHDIYFFVRQGEVYAHHMYLEDDMPVNSDEQFEAMLNTIVWKIASIA